MPTNTYVALDKVTVGTATNSITFSSIPSTYTDLVIVANFTGSGSGNNLMMQVGNTTIDTGSNYSGTGIYGNGTSALSWRQSNVTAIQATYAIGLEALNVSSIHLMNYSNTTTYKTILNRSGGLNGTYNATEATVSLWRNTAAINTIKLYGLNSATISVGSTFSLYGIKAWTAETTPKATGGYVYEDSTYYYHSFPFSGTFTPNQSLTADILCVAGGGGTSSNFPGGGGAGGLLALTSQSLSATDYTVTVGAGGAGTTDPTRGNNGVNSQFGGLTAAVGGGGSGARNGTIAGQSGGSGGGAAFWNAAGGSGTSGQGNAGGNSFNSIAPNYGTGAGGGAGAAGGNGNSTTTPSGGVGSSAYSSWGAATGIGENVNGTYWFAGGGSGVGDISAGVGGLGGGASCAAANQIGANGMANTGGGAAGTTKNGGSGVIIVRYAK